MRYFLTLVCATLFISGTPLEAQSASVLVKIELAAARHLDSSYFSAGAHTLDGVKVLAGIRVLDSLPVRGRARTTAENLALANSVTGARVGKARDNVVCDSGAIRTCRMIGATALLRMGRPEVVGDSATIDVTVDLAQPNLPRIPIASRDLKLTLKQRNGMWYVLSDVPVGRS